MIRAVIAAICIAGCTRTPPAPFAIADKDPACARGCLANHSQCVSQASIATSNRLIANDVLRSCRSATDACLGTCEVR